MCPALWVKGKINTKERALEVLWVRIKVGGVLTPLGGGGQAFIPSWTLVIWEGLD